MQYRFEVNCGTLSRWNLYEKSVRSQTCCPPPGDYKFRGQAHCVVQGSKGARPIPQLGPDATLRAKIRANCISPFAALIHLNAIRTAKKRACEPQKASRASGGLSERPGIRGEFLEYVSVSYLAIASSEKSKSAHSSSLNDDAVEVPAIGRWGASSTILIRPMVSPSESASTRFNCWAGA